MDRGQANVIVGDLARAMGIEALALDDNGMCVVALEEGADKVVVSIGHNAGAGALDLMACLDTVDPSPQRVAEALIANFRSAPAAVTLAAEPSTGAFVVQRRYYARDLGDGGLPEALIAFVTEAMAWTRHLQEIADDEPAPSRSRSASIGLRA